MPFVMLAECADGAVPVEYRSLWTLLFLGLILLLLIHLNVKASQCHQLLRAHHS